MTEPLFSWRNMAMYYINLDLRNDRRLHMESELMRVGLNAQRIRGLLHYEYDGHSKKYDVMRTRTVGSIGCHLSHVECMRRALKENKHVLIMEDDAVFCDDMKERFPKIQTFLNENEWDIFWLGGTFHVNPPFWHTVNHNKELQQCHCKLGRDAEQTDDPNIMRTYGAFSAYAYIININSIEKIMAQLEAHVHESMGIDWLYILLQPELKTYAFVPGCVKQMDGVSNIGDGETTFSHFEKLGAYWWQQNESDFNPAMFEWHEASKKVPFAIIVPYRDRQEHLELFIEHYTKLIPDAHIYIIEQTQRPFNRAKLLNIGFLEAGKNYEYAIYSDVDMLPSRGFVDLSPPVRPTHLATRAEQFGWEMPYENYFGGVVMLTKDHMEKVDGFSNEFWGYGGEDDEMRINIEKHGLSISRRNCLFMSLDHEPAIKNAQLYAQNLLLLEKGRGKDDGLTNCKYEVVSRTEEKGFTRIKVAI